MHLKVSSAKRRLFCPGEVELKLFFVQDKDLLTMHTVTAADLPTQEANSHGIDSVFLEYSSCARVSEGWTCFVTKYFISPDLYRGDSIADISQRINGVSSREIVQ